MSVHYPSHSAYYTTGHYHMHVTFQHRCADTVQDTAQQHRPQTTQSTQFPKGNFSFVHTVHLHHYIRSHIRCVLYILGYTLGSAEQD